MVQSRYSLTGMASRLLLLLLVPACVHLGFGQVATATTTALAVSSGGNSVSTVSWGSVVTLTANVTAGSTPLTRGQVEFCDATAKYCTDVHVLGPAQLTTAGAATLKFRPGIGSHSYKAVFLGTQAYKGSSSATASLAVTGTAAPIASTSSITETGSWGDYTLTATVTEAGKTTGPTGSVSFLDSNNGNSVLATGTLGTATGGIGWPSPGSLANISDTRYVQVGDFNGDGIPDLAIDDNPLVIYLGNANGTFTEAPVPNNPGPTAGPIVLADFNGDGIQDIALGMYGSSTIAILLGKGDGTFAPPLNLVVSGNISEFTQLITADFNGDGIPDLAFPAGSTLEVYLGNGDGTFTAAATSPTVSGNVGYIAAGDFNGDGKQDFAVGIGGDSIAIYLGNGDGTFTAGTPIHCGVNNAPMAVADFNGDGKLDLAVAGGGLAGTAETVTILTGNGDGTFNAPSSTQAASSTIVTFIQAADFNQDGSPDVVLADQNGNATVVLNSGSGSFSQSFPVVSGLSVPYYLMVGVGDLNGDGHPDIVVGGYYNNTLGLYLTEPTETSTISAPVSLPAGLHQVDASYAGDANYNPSASSTTPLWGAPAATTTTLSVTAGGTAVTSVAPGIVVTLTASVVVGSTPVTAGQVNFCDATASHCRDVHIVGTATLTSSGTAAFKFVPGPGTHSYQAEFVQNGLGAQSVSGAASLTVGPAPSPVYSDTMSISSSGGPGNYSLQATMVGYGGSAAPTGTVSFLDSSFGNASLGTAQLGSSTAGMGWLVAQSPALGGSYPVSEVTADFNHDGIPDLAVVWTSSPYGGPYSLTVFFGKGDGTFTTGPTTSLSSLVSVRGLSMVAGDFNGDGSTDLAVLSESVGSNISYVTTFLGQGDGTFASGKTNQVYDQGFVGGDVLSGSMVSGDFNGDGKLDLAVVGDCINACGVTILLGKGDGTFTASSSPLAATQSFSVIATGDFNGDGIPDLVAANSFSPGGATVFLGKGDGTFTTVSAQIPAGTFPHAIVAGDFNGDGVPDLAFGFNGAIWIYIGNGDGTFTAGQQVSGSGLSLIAGDFNHDGKLDLASVEDAYSEVGLFLGKGDGTFTAVNTTPSTLNGSTFGNTSIVAADFNGDGVSDVALMLPNSQSLYILLTEPTQTATATVSGIAPVGAGVHNVEASYPGDSNYPASVSGTVALTPGLAPLVVTPASGTYTSAQTITITEATPGATIYYSAYGILNTNGYVPYTGPIALNEGGTEIIQAYATETGYEQTSSVYLSYTISLPRAPQPVFSLAPGSYAGSQSVSISDSVSGAAIYYTTDGTTPTRSSAVYSGPITVSTSETLAATAIAPGYSMSAPTSGLYLINSAATSFIYTFAGNGTNGYDGDGGQATAAYLNTPGPAVMDSAGNVYFSDEDNALVRKIAAGTGIITTFAGTGVGGYSGDGGPATSAQLHYPEALAMDGAGNLYISDVGNEVIRKVAAGTGIITTYAGTGNYFLSGDGGPATNAGIGFVEGLAVDASGNLYLSESYTIRVVNATTGIITTIAGKSYPGYSGDGGPALSATLNGTYGVTVDAAGNLYIADAGNNVIREVNKASGNISTIAGNGHGAGSYLGGAFSGDGGPATSAELNYPQGIALDGSGNLYIADYGNQRIREVTVASGVITTIAGNGSQCNSIGGDGGPATASALCEPYGVALDHAGNVYVSDYSDRIREVTVAANPPTAAAASPAFSVTPGIYPNAQVVTISDATPGAEIYLRMDGTTPATTGQGYNGPITVDGNATINAIAVAPGFLPSAPASPSYTITTPPSLLMTTVAGTGQTGFSGQGGPAVQAQLGYLAGVAADSSGNVYVSDSANNVVWMVAAATGNISVYAGNGTVGYSGDNGPATSAQLFEPEGIALDSAGNLYIVDFANGCIREVVASTGIITTVAGGGGIGTYGDGGPATSADLGYPESVAVDASGNLYIADTNHNTVRKVAAATGIINTVAGNKNAGASTGDGGAATSATVPSPGALALDRSGNLFISTPSTGQVRKVAAGTGIITTVAGDGNPYGATGDGGSATKAEINPQGLAVDAAGNLYIANPPGAIRKVDATTGNVTRYAGNGYKGSGGDGGSAMLAGLCNPQGIAFSASGTLHIADSCNYRVREVMAPAAAATPVFGLAAGTYIGPRSVTITDTTPNAAIYYTVDGSTPTTASTQYSRAITVSASETLNAIAVAAGLGESAVASAAYTINARAVPVVTWPTPAAITYGTALSTAQLDATASVPGTFTYSPVIGTVLNVGQQTLNVTFTPTDATDYTTVQKTVTLAVNRATPTITWATPAAINFGTALGSAQLNATASVPGSFVYSPGAGTLPPAGSDKLSVTFTPTDASNYSTATASVTLIVNPFNPIPNLATLTPGIASAGGAPFTLTVGGSGFQASSVIYWGTVALSTQFVSATQLTAQVPASAITNSGTVSVSIQTPAPGGGTSNAMQFEIDTASSSTPPSYTSSSATVTAGSTATYSVTLPSTAANVSLQCLNLPAGATCTYSAASGTVTIATSATTPKGTYQITTVFTETLPGAAGAGFFLPFLILPILYYRKRLNRATWLLGGIALAVAMAAISSTGCGGGGSTTPPPAPQTHVATSSTTVTLIVQ